MPCATILFLITLGFLLESATAQCSDHLYVVDNGNLIVSSDGGLNWNYATLLSVINVVASKTSLLYAGTSQGLQVSTDQGVKWERIDLLPSTWDCDILAISEGTKFALVGGLTHQPELHPFLLRSDDNWNSWSEISLPFNQSGVTMKSMQVDGDTIYLGCGLTGNGNGDVFYISRDAGSTWTSVNSSKFGVVYSSIDSIAFEGSKVYVSGYPAGRYISMSDDGGVNWKSQDLTSVFGSSVFCIDDIVASNGLVYVSGNIQCKLPTASRLVISPDAGSTWTVTHDFYPPGLLNNKRLAVLGNNIYYATSGGIYYSPDNGQTWAGSIVSCRKGQKIIPCQIFDIYAQCY